MPNLRAKTYQIPELMQSISLLLSSRAIRTIDKHGGITPAIMNAKEAMLSDRLRKIRGQIYRKQVKATFAGATVEGKAAKAAKVKAPKEAKAAAPVAKAPKAAKKAPAKAKAKK